MDFNELNVTFDARHEHAILDIINYVCSTGVSRVTSIGALRDGIHLIDAISLYEKHTGWQSSRVIDLFFKFKNDAISGYVFINGWLDTYYNCGHIIAGDGLRFASDREVMTIAILVANVLYSRRQSLTNDLKLRLDAVWIDLNSVADWIMLWIRTRAQLIPNDTTLHSCAHQLFSGHSLYEYQAIQQRLTLMVQQKLINEQNKKLADQELAIQKHAKDYSSLREKLCEILQEVDQLKKSHSSLVDEVKWEKDINTELNDTIAKLRAENNELKKLNGGSVYAEQNNNNNNTLFNDAIDHKLSEENNASDDCLESIGERKHHQNHRNIYSHLNASSTFKCNNSNAINGNISGLDIDRNLDDKQRITADITHHSSTEDITDSGNHSDAADDLLIDIYQCCSPPKEAQSSQQSLLGDKDESESLSDSLFNYHSWHEFFSKHGDSGGGNNNNNEDNCEHDDHSNPNNDTYKSNQHFGTTNSDNICINF